MDPYGNGSALPSQSFSETLPHKDIPTDIEDLDWRATTRCSNFSENILSESLDFLSEDSANVASPEVLHNINCTPKNTVQQVDDLEFLVSQDSIAFSEGQLENIPKFVDDFTVSPSFNQSRQLVCEDSFESASCDATSSTLFQDCHDQAENDGFLLGTTEETSLDSGLGSVESVYPNSEEESTEILSPDPAHPLSSSQDETGQLSLASTSNSSDSNRLPNADEFFDCLSDIRQNRKLNKRTHGSDSIKDDQPPVKKRKAEKRVSFETVSIFYFPRNQGFVSVPSQGGSTLGMAMRHVDHTVMSLQEHNQDLEQRHKEKIHEHLREQKVEEKIKQLKFINPDLDNGTLSSMALSAVGQTEMDHQADDASRIENFDEFFFLQPISTKKRRKLLRLSGVERIDGEEKFVNRILRESREICGCTCEQVCIPETCECALSGIQCQVDRESFPCGCFSSGCRNESGRVEFDSERVRVHHLATLEKLQHDENASAETQNEGCCDQTASSESECDFASSDDAEQSDAEMPDPLQPAQFLSPIQTVFITSANSEQNSTETNPSAIPQDFLDTLGLKRVEIVEKENPQLSSPVLCSANHHIHRSFPYDLTHGQYSTPHPCRYSTIESLAQSVPDPQLAHQMYGTTSVMSYSHGTSAIDRDLSTPLDPIATFMSANYNVATTESIACSGNFY